jgi:NAD(P)-dependent dehydrogenase (short-subunit alcohol dehydrogenase family)
MRGLDGKAAIVTGGGHGIGRASAQRLAAEGARVLVVDIDGTAAREVAASLPTKSAACAGDIASEADTQTYMARALAEFGRIDLYHLNAGISGTLVPLPELSLADFDAVMQVNLRGTFLGLRVAFRQYTDQGGGGAICLTASIASLRGSADLLPYQASKHGVLGLLHGAALYGGPLGIRVNAVAPGIVPTDLFAAMATAPGGKDDMVRRAATTPLRRAGTADEIASVAAFLLSDDASYITGEVISADGGAACVSTVRPSGGAGSWDTTAVDERMYQDRPSAHAQVKEGP